MEDNGEDQLGRDFDIINGWMVKDVEEAVAKLKLGKAVGADDIPNEFIKRGGESLATALHKIFCLFNKQQVFNKYSSAIIYQQYIISNIQTNQAALFMT